MWRKVLSGLLILVAGGLLLGVVDVAAAASGRSIDGVVGLRGEITALKVATMKVSAGERIVTIFLTPETRYRVIGKEEPSIGDLAAGDRVLVRGERREDGVLVAAWVAKVPEGEHRRGRVVEVGAESLVLSAVDDESVVVAVSDATMVALGASDYPWNDGGREQVRAGMPVFLFGDFDETGEPIASTIVVVRRGRPLPARNVRHGEIVSLAEGSFMLETPGRGTITVVTDEATRYRLAEETSPLLADFDVGDTVVVLGRPVDESVFLARLLVLRPRGAIIAGTIEQREGDLITLTARGGETWTVITDEVTRFHVGRCAATLDRFAVGDRIVAFGEKGDDDHVLAARHIARRAFRPACRLRPFAATPGQ